MVRESTVVYAKHWETKGGILLAWGAKQVFAECMQVTAG